MTKLLPGLWVPAIFLTLWAGLIVAGRENFLRDPGTFWHTVVGERILSHGFAETDEYTFTFAGEPWIPHQWLGEIGMAAAYRVNGLHAVLAGGTALLAGLFTLLAVRWLRTGLHPILCAVVIGLTLASSATHFHLRPHLFTMLGVMLTMRTLIEIDSGRKRWTAAAWLIPLYAVWANVHGGLLGGLMMLGLTGTAWSVLALLGKPSPIAGARSFAGLAGIGVACGLTAFLTPYGPRIFETWIAIMQAKRLPEIIAEHAPFDITRIANAPTALMALGYVGLLLNVPRRSWKASWFLPLFWMLQAYGRVRHAPLFSICACLVLAEVWPHTRMAARLAASRPDFHADAGRFVPMNRLALVGVLLALGFGFLWQATRHSSTEWAKLDPAYWPTDLDEALAEHSPESGAPNRLFNDYIDGGYIIRRHPSYKVFVDDRCELFGDEWLVEFVLAGVHDDRTANYLADAQAKYGRFDFALTRPDTAFDRWVTARPEEWQVIQTTPTARFAKRITPSPGSPGPR